MRLNGTAYCHKAMRNSYSEVGFRSGRRAPSATASGRSKAYRPYRARCSSVKKRLGMACGPPNFCNGPAADRGSMACPLQNSYAKKYICDKCRTRRPCLHESISCGLCMYCNICGDQCLHQICAIIAHRYSSQWHIGKSYRHASYIIFHFNAEICTEIKARSFSLHVLRSQIEYDSLGCAITYNIILV